MSDVFQWIGGNDAGLASAGNWFDTSSPGVVQSPGANDVAIIQSGQGLHGTLNVAALDIVQSSGAPIISITGADTSITAASIGIANGFTLDDQAYLQAGTLGIDGNGTVVTVQNDAYLADQGGMNDVFAIGASSGASTLLIKGGLASYDPQDASGTMSLGDVSGSVATMTISAGGNFTSLLGALRIGGASGATGSLNVTGAGSEFTVDNDGTTTIGDFGGLGGAAKGSISVTAGAYVSLNSAGEVEIGTTDGMAEVLVSGANSEIEAGPRVDVGGGGASVAGEVLVQDGGEFDDPTDFYLNNGTLSVTGANSLFEARSLEVNFDTTFQIGSGGLVHVADLDLAGVLTLAGGSVNVRADLTMFGFDDAEIIGYGSVSAATIDADALIVASGGTLAISGAIAGGDGTAVTGEIDAGATLQLNGAVSAGQDIAFMAATGTLLLDKASAFAATTSGFVHGDMIDLAGISTQSLSYSGHTLTVHETNGTSLALAFAGTYSQISFGFGSDGHGGTSITETGAIVGGDGNDDLSGGAGNDIIDGGAGDDTINAGAGADTVTGGPGNDTIYGNGGADILNGNGGADKLIGGAGRDTLTGGAGADTFVYLLATDSTAADPDLITDFTHGSDKIDLTLLHLASAKDVVISSSSGLTYLSIDSDNNGSFDMIIKLTGSNVLTASDILGVPAASVAIAHAGTTETAPATVDHHDLATSLHAVAVDHGLYG